MYTFLYLCYIETFRNEVPVLSLKDTSTFDHMNYLMNVLNLKYFGFIWDIYLVAYIRDYLMPKPFL